MVPDTFSCLPEGCTVKLGGDRPRTRAVGEGVGKQWFLTPLSPPTFISPPFFFSDHRIFGWGESLMCGLSDRTEVSMYIRRVVFAVVFLLITTGVAWAGKESYKLVMSQ